MIAVRPPDQQGIVESGATEHLPIGAFDGIPVRRVTMLDAGPPETPQTPPDRGWPGFTQASHDAWQKRHSGEGDPPATRAARTPLLALSATITVIAVVFILALSLAALAYLLSG